MYREKNIMVVCIRGVSNCSMSRVVPQKLHLLVGTSIVMSFLKINFYFSTFIVVVIL